MPSEDFFKFRLDFETKFTYDVLRDSGFNLSKFTREAVNHAFKHMTKRNYCKKLLLDEIERTKGLITRYPSLWLFCKLHIKALKEVVVALEAEL